MGKFRTNNKFLHPTKMRTPVQSVDELTIDDDLTVGGNIVVSTDNTTSLGAGEKTLHDVFITNKIVHGNLQITDGTSQNTVTGYLDSTGENTAGISVRRIAFVQKAADNDTLEVKINLNKYGHAYVRFQCMRPTTNSSSAFVFWEGYLECQSGYVNTVSLNEQLTSNSGSMALALTVASAYNSGGTGSGDFTFRLPDPASGSLNGLGSLYFEEIINCGETITVGSY